MLHLSKPNLMLIRSRLRALSDTPERVAFVVIAVCAILYCLAYYFTSVRPRADATYPLGWYGWADQGEYIKSIAAFGTGIFTGDRHHYPPLYAMLAAPFYRLTPTHPQFFPDLIFFLVSVYALIRISARLYGVLLAPVVFAILMIAAPLLTITQWVIPWTTSLQTALFSALFLIVLRFERNRNPFVVATRLDFLAYGAFFLLYGALLPTRPLDFAVAFPLALFFFLRTIVATIKASPPQQRIKTIGILALVAASAGLPFVALYFGFNLIVFKNLFGGYANAISEFRYDPSTILEKSYSIFLQSGAIYGEDGQAFFEKVPLMGLAFAICAVTAVVCNDIRRWIVLLAFFHILLYMPYGDLLPTGVFRYYNLHYFKWMYPWLFVIAAGQAIIWGRGIFDQRGWIPLTAALLLALIVANISIVPLRIEGTTDARAPANNAVTVTVPRPLDVDFIDITGIAGGFTDLYLINHAAVLDAARPIQRRDFRLLPMPNSARMLFSRPTQLSSVVLTPGAGVKVLDGGTSSAGQFRFAFACRFHSCSESATP